MKYSVTLEKFLRSGAEFTLVYNSAKKTLAVPRILILDSSFNPPHMAHFTIVKEALGYDFKDTANLNDSAEREKQEKSILLLLSVKNADKVVPVPASFEHRLAMMKLMAKELENEYTSVGIGLTTHAKFADKSAAIQDYLQATSSWHLSSTRLTFLLGFDTLIRVLDPKYYAPLSLSESLDKFMINTDLFCLTRAESDAKFEEQQTYPQRIARGEFPNIPRQWSKNIYVKTKDDHREVNGAISSSGVRSAYKENPKPDNLPLLKEVANYIESNRLYL